MKINLSFEVAFTEEINAGGRIYMCMSALIRNTYSSLEFWCVRFCSYFCFKKLFKVVIFFLRCSNTLLKGRICRMCSHVRWCIDIKCLRIIKENIIFKIILTISRVPIYTKDCVLLFFMISFKSYKKF